MITRSLKLSILTLLSLMLVSAMVFGQQSYEVKSFKMTVSGTSTLHDWESEATVVTAEASLEVNSAGLNIQKVLVTVPVEKIVSPKGKIMDNKTYEAFNSEKNPNIQFTLTKIDQVTGSNGSYDVKATGKLKMAGAEKSISLTVKAKVGDDGLITFSGSKTLNMTEWSMDPPKALMGTIKTGEEVTVNFSVKMAAAGGSTASK